MSIITMIVMTILLAIAAIGVGLPLYAVPATLTLPAGRRPGVESLTITQAAQRLRVSGQTGMALIEAARALVGERMAYCRRNGFDNHRRAFERGYGYCQQSAYALTGLLRQLGFEAKVVHAFQNRFPGERITSHARVSVTVAGETHYVDPLFWDAEAGKVAFTPLSPVLSFSPAFRILAEWGSMAVNAYRYYRTGKDYDG
jgi:transglutaminase-like putative cysteine protease